MIKSRKTGFIVKYLMPILLVSILYGCSKAVKEENMMPSKFDVVNRHPFTVSLTVKGKMGLSSARGSKDDIDQEKLTRVIQRSLIESGLFEALASEQEADYILKVIVFKANILGTVTATITTAVPMNWVLMQRNPSKSVYQKRTSNQVSVKAKDNFGAASRYSKANEGSVNKNIHEAIFDLSQLDL